MVKEMWNAMQRSDTKEPMDDNAIRNLEGTVANTHEHDKQIKERQLQLLRDTTTGRMHVVHIPCQNSTPNAPEKVCHLKLQDDETISFRITCSCSYGYCI